MRATATTFLIAAAGAFGLFSIVWLGLFTVARAFAAGVLAVLLYAAWELPGLYPALAFLFLGSLWTLWPGGARGKKRRRVAVQVLANGSVAGLAALGQLLLPHPAWVFVMTGSFAAVAADTWSTEWGRAFGGRPLCLRRLKRVDPGESGAVSAAGFLASLAGAGSVALAAIVGDLVPVRSIPLILLAGFAGSLVDSLAGAWLQARWRDREGKITEERRDAGLPRPLRGVRWIDNNTVNLIAAITGALVAFAFRNIAVWS